MEKWIKEAKERAKAEAEFFVESMVEIADEMNIERTWFVEEVVKHIHKIKDGDQ